MRRIAPLLLVLATTLGLSLAVAPGAGAAPPPPSSWGGALAARNVVFVQTDNPAGNQVVAYDRAADGTLSGADTYHTGGLGGVLNGSVVDHLASQGSLAYNAGQGLLYAVNAGSDTVSVFAVHGDALALQQVVGSGGAFPVSVAVHGDLVYVLNALGGGSIQGFVSAFGHLFPLPWSNRNLGLTIPSDDHPVREHARSGRVLAVGLTAHRHHEGQRERHRRVRRRTVRRAVGVRGGEPRGRYGALRHLI